MAGRRRLRTLLTLWAAYWAGLAVVQVGPLLWEYLRLQATVGTGTVSWSFSGSLSQLALALVGPPLLIWAGWLAVPGRERRVTRENAKAPLSEAWTRSIGAPAPELRARDPRRAYPRRAYPRRAYGPATSRQAADGDDLGCCA